VAQCVEAGAACATYRDRESVSIPDVQCVRRELRGERAADSADRGDPDAAEFGDGGGICYAGYDVIGAAVVEERRSEDQKIRGSEDRNAFGGLNSDRSIYKPSLPGRSLAVSMPSTAYTIFSFGTFT